MASPGDQRDRVGSRAERGRGSGARPRAGARRRDRVLGVVLAAALAEWRIVARLEAIEAAISGSADPLLGGGGLVGALGAGLGDGGLPVGAPTPEFTLLSTEGDRHALGSLLAPGVPPLLVFSDSGCGPCDTLLPELAERQRELHQRLQIAVIDNGDPEPQPREGRAARPRARAAADRARGLRLL